MAPDHFAIEPDRARVASRPRRDERLAAVGQCLRAVYEPATDEAMLALLASIAATEVRH